MLSDIQARANLCFLPARRNRIKFIEKEYARLSCLCSFKQITHRLFTSTDILVQNLRTLDTNKV